ncbi:AI-2E family transporter [Geobacter sp. DSM 9736]|uniref:AI-2E family transporter n=1 Tax=Geobacter sp. DSM 9736 TaxID=1277350 RepID=UPI000B4FE336|nr:AI-2E family transporter [Geobacter sp. DSM 9736]SNB48030.1 Predicted PurR-regulated permease PerM [Geobacter sp. DSM 9736]
MDSERSRLNVYYVVTAFLATIIASAYLIQHTFSAVATSLALAYLLNPLLKYLDRRGFSRFLSITFLYGIVALTAFILSFVLIPYIAHQASTLVTVMPLYTHRIQTSLETWKSQLSPLFNPEELSWVIARIDEGLDRVVSEISGSGYERLKEIVFAFFDLLLAPVLVFFLLYYKEELKESILGIIPATMRPDLIHLGRKINRSLEKFIWGMLVDCFLVAILCAAALYLLDVEFPILNGIFAGFATLMPFVGAIIAMVPPAFIGYAKSGDVLIIPKVCAIYFLINVVVEANIIKPFIMRGALQLNPLAVIFSVMALGELMGFWGIVLAVPLTAVLKICGQELHEIRAGAS